MELQGWEEPFILQGNESLSHLLAKANLEDTLKTRE